MVTDLLLLLTESCPPLFVVGSIVVVMSVLLPLWAAICCSITLNTSSLNSIKRLPER